ncbi:helix-turn-helix domain-containing protein [Alteromonas aestuariivivens]|uniref:Helix-turn-helix domain-containing protein n=1 Tax=Alteromonas aestuariivivens TaxID=1938339 RepID=A0A3D8M8R2_9ALTE|nr:DNA-binding transcriptional regulator [Alteromonas aestuariivivens]RDV25591.1 helix-turn-helix domain-containing protein [Alteromonas aestuariivivens]
MFENKHSITMLFNASKVYDRQIIEGIGSYLQTSKVDWDLYLEEDFMARLDHLDEWSGDGIIADYDNPKIQAALQKAQVPVVGIGGSYKNPEDYPDVPYVATDNYELVNAAFQHLRQKGIQRFAFYGAPLDEHQRWAVERENAMIDITSKEGYECYVYRGHPVRPETWQYTIKRLSDWLRSLPTPIGIVAVTDARARHLLQVCDHIGMLIPEKMAVIGIDDDEIARFLSRVSLSSVKQGCFEMGYQAAKFLHKILQGYQGPKKPILVPPERVAERQSTDFKAIADPHVMQAMHFIRQNACRGIKVDQVLDYVGISRSNLENRFKEERGHSIHTEIHNEKLTRACKMLKESDESTADIARICGYPSLQYMYAVFKKHYAKTPIEFREASRPTTVELDLEWEQDE